MILKVMVVFGCGFFAYSWKLPAYSGALFLTVYNFSFFACSWSFFAYSFGFFTYSWSFFAYSGKVRLIRALRDCKQRSLTVRKKAPTVGKKASPVVFTFRHPNLMVQKVRCCNEIVLGQMVARSGLTAIQMKELFWCLIAVWSRSQTSGFAIADRSPSAAAPQRCKTDRAIRATAIMILAAQNRKLRAARFPESQSWNRQKFRSEKKKMSRIAAK